jgi:hypothetical protein
MTGGFSIYLGTTSRFSSDNNGGFGINYGTTGGTATASLSIYNNTTATLELNRDGSISSGAITANGTVTTPTLRLTSNEDAALGSTTHAFQVGASNGGNIIMDTNEIMARSNGSASGLHLNAEGGDVTFRNNGSGTTNLVMSGQVFLDHSRNATLNTISSGSITSSSTVTAPYFVAGSNQHRVKFSTWTGTTYGIGMKNGFSFGGLTSYAICSQMNTSAGRGFWWGTNAHSDAQGAMALRSDGKLTVATAMRLGYGINDTTNPGATHALDVSGSIYASSDIYADGGNLIIGDDAFSQDANYVGIKTSAMTGSSDYMIISGISGDGNTYISAKDGSSVYIRGGGNNSTNEIRVTDGTYIQVDTNNLNVEGNVTAFHSSDESLKENIRVIDNPIERIQKIRGVFFDWTDDYIKNQSGDGAIDIRKDDVGVIAQDVQPVLDEVVTARKDGTLAVRYEKMVALCIEAIKDQQDQIDSLKDIIEDMKNGNN